MFSLINYKSTGLMSSTLWPEVSCVYIYMSLQVSLIHSKRDQKDLICCRLVFFMSVYVECVWWRSGRAPVWQPSLHGAHGPRPHVEPCSKLGRVCGSRCLRGTCETPATELELLRPAPPPLWRRIPWGGGEMCEGWWRWRGTMLSHSSAPQVFLPHLAQR